MLNKREKKSFGAYIDYFLENCLVVSKSFEVTHIHILRSNTIPPGLYGYEPKTGMVKDSDGDHFGILNWNEAVRWAQGTEANKLVFLKHRDTWKEMVEQGLIKGNDDALAWNSNKKEESDGVPAKKETPTTGSGLGFLKKMFKK